MWREAREEQGSLGVDAGAYGKRRTPGSPLPLVAGPVGNSHVALVGVAGRGASGRSAGRLARKLDRLLRMFGDVRAGEGLAASVMALNVFVLLTAYYVLKTVREPLILLSGTLGLEGDELKIYGSAAQAVVLMLLLPFYERLVARFDRVGLVRITLLLFIGSLGVFIALGAAGVAIGIAFYLWLGVVALLGIAQFWSVANDLHTREQGERLFGIIAIGGSIGAIAGAQLSRWLVGPLGVHQLMGIAAALYALSIPLVGVAERLIHRTRKRVVVQPPMRKGALALLVHDRYLLLIAVLLVLANLVNTHGEFILADAVKDRAERLVPATFGAIEAVRAERRAVIGRFYGNFYTVVNLCALALQALVVSRFLRKGGIRIALFVLPVIAFGGYSLVALVPSLMVVALVKAAENSVDYSLQNTTRQALFLPTTREAKYVAKAAIDTGFVRLGDALAAGLVAIGLHGLHLSRAAFATLNVSLAAVWLLVAIAIARRHQALVGASHSTWQVEPQERKRAPRGRRLLTPGGASL